MRLGFNPAPCSVFFLTPYVNVREENFQFLEEISPVFTERWKKVTLLKIGGKKLTCVKKARWFQKFHDFVQKSPSLETCPKS